MFLKKITLSSLTFAIALGCTFSASATEKDHAHEHKGYFKPGAAVTLTYDYDGTTQPGELENITLKIEHFYSDGYLSARLLGTPDLQIISHGSLENEKLQASSSVELPIQLSAVNAGEYFISLEVVHESIAGEQSLRVLSLPIQVGNLQASKNAAIPTRTSKPSGQKGLVILTAQETIK